MTGSSAEELRHQHRDRMIWIPRRCEAQGCDKRVGLQKCSRCTCVMYCSTKCQKRDWARHKLECKHLAGLNLQGFPFSDAEMLARQPLAAPPTNRMLREYVASIPPAAAAAAPAPAGPSTPTDAPPSCGLCGATGPLTRTACCGEWVCDRSEAYVMHSFSRAFCDRNHERYSLCGVHHEEGHAGDWRTCTKCMNAFAHRGAREWQSSNGYNFVPGLEVWYPKGQMLTDKCERCGVRIYYGLENSSSTAQCCGGKVHAFCEECTRGGFGGPFRSFCNIPPGGFKGGPPMM